MKLVLVVVVASPGHALLEHLSHRRCRGRRRRPVTVSATIHVLATTTFSTTPRRRMARVGVKNAGRNNVTVSVVRCRVGGRGAGELLHDGAELGRGHDVDDGGGGVPSPPVLSRWCRRRATAGSAIVAAVVAAAHCACPPASSCQVVELWMHA